MELGDSASTIDTLLLYQVLGYSYGNEGTEARVDDFQRVFTITIRIKVVENTAALPIPPDSR